MVPRDEADSIIHGNKMGKHLKDPFIAGADVAR
jgi:hypothetical protein